MGADGDGLDPAAAFRLDGKRESSRRSGRARACASTRSPPVSDAGSYVTGQVPAVDGGWTAV